MFMLRQEFTPKPVSKQVVKGFLPFKADAMGCAHGKEDHL
ncbi:hypothetical protein X474_24900 [Dethiosulfatarculus sandiegensis]|uniref:Uncharacterized protein n=1 Tax=Dethiosulfatarculus sandiegensis TaxID=1429043 RepID=A0A0D2JQ33_9BACT|nr:hypothetical protein X474_24900 [Dethiosulfatarculus sandiegensis]